jgi:hypothetical protein
VAEVFGIPAESDGTDASQSLSIHVEVLAKARMGAALEQLFS